MQQPPNGSPQRGTQPLRQPNTRPFSDTFVSSGGPAAPASTRGTRPLQPLGTDALKTLVPQKLTEVQKDLDYVKHLTTLFSAPVTLLRYAVHLVDAPPVPEEADGAETDEAPTSAPFRGLTTAQRTLAHDVAEVLRRDPKLKQRTMVALFQFDDTLKSHREAAELMDEIYGCDFAAAWERLPLLGIERLKGKAYAICGFYENFKHDPVLNRVFPAPHNGGSGATGPLINASPGRTGPLVQPVTQPQADTSLNPNGLLGKLKGLFGK